jgi:uncharacterized membrane protein YphA (DoxX/SURF4 family)
MDAKELRGWTMGTRAGLGGIGLCIYAAGAITLGVVGLVSGDFAGGWQRVPASVPHRELLAYCAAVYELLAGLALVWRPTRRVGAGMLALLFALFVLAWVPAIVHAPRVYDGWGNFFEELSMAIGGATAWAALAPAGSLWVGRAPWIARLYGLCAISYGLDHLSVMRGVASWVPRWLPPGQMFWAIVTTVCFFLAAAAILSGILAGLAARLLAFEIAGFELLVWIPKLVAGPHLHFNWAGNAVSVAITGGAWVVADELNAARKARLTPDAPSPQKS